VTQNAPNDAEPSSPEFDGAAGDDPEADPTEADPTEADPTEADPTEADPTEADPTEAPTTALAKWQQRTRIERLRAPIILALVAMSVYALFAWDRVGAPSPNNHFVYLADSFLNKTVEMRVDPPHGNDWASIETLTSPAGDTYRGIWYDRRANKFLTTTGELYIFDRAELRSMRMERTYYVSFPPAPAVLMLPGVAIWGMNFNDVLFTILFAGANVGLFYVLLRQLSLRGISRLRARENIWITILYAFGTAHLWCSVLGMVWFTALVVGATFTLLYMICSVDCRHPLLAGLFLAGAFATRTPLLFSVVFFAIFFFFPGGKLRRDFGASFWRTGICFAIFPLIIGCALMWLNMVRFDSLTEFGHRFLAGGQIDRIKHYGLFNVRFISLNLTALLALVPKFQSTAPYIIVSQHGLAIWFTTPALLYFFASRYGSRPEQRLWVSASLCALAVIAIPHILYQNTGWVQFGYRFAMDYLPYLLVLLVLSRPRVTWGLKALIIIGICINAFGAVTFDRMPEHYGPWVLETERP